MNTNQNKVVEQEEDLETFIKYDTSYFTEAFNRILFNLMMRQAKRNEQVQFAEIDRKIKLSAQRSLKQFEDIVNNVDGDIDAANFFTKLVFGQQLQAVKKELLDLHDDKVDEMDSEITKEDNLKLTNKVFQNADDTETII